MRSRYASVSSREESSPAAISSAWRARPGEDGIGGRGGGHGGGGYRAWDDRPLHVTDVDAIAEGLARFEARGPCTDAERRAAGWLHDELRDAGHEAWVETHWVRPQWALSVAPARDDRRGGVAGGDRRAAPGAGRGGGRGGLDGARGGRAARAAAAGAPAAGDPERADGAGGGRRHAAHRAPYCRARGGLGRRFVEGRQAWVALALALRRGVRGAAGARARRDCGSGCCSSCRRSRCCSRSRRRATRRSPSYVPGGEAAPGGRGRAPRRAAPQPADRLAPALLLHGALRAHLRREKPDRRTIVLLELGPGSALAFATSHPKLRGAAESAGSVQRVRRPVRRRLPTLWIGVDAADEGRWIWRSRASTRSTSS